MFKVKGYCPIEPYRNFLWAFYSSDQNKERIRVKKELVTEHPNIIEFNYLIDLRAVSNTNVEMNYLTKTQRIIIFLTLIVENWAFGILLSGGIIGLT